MRVTVGLTGTPPGVLILTGWLRSPSPLRVIAAAWTAYRVSGCSPVTLLSSASVTSNLNGSLSNALF